MIKIIASLLLIAIGASLGGCAATRLEATDSFSAQSDDALVVAGLKLEFKPPIVGNSTPKLGVVWARYQDDRIDYFYGAWPNVMAIGIDSCDLTEDVCKTKDTHYFAVRVKPGSYLMTGFNVRPCEDGCPSPALKGMLTGGASAAYYEAGRTYNFSAIRLRENNIGKQEPDPTVKPSESDTHKFDVKAGEVVYIGTFVLVDSPTYRLEKVFFDLPAARKFLQSFPNVEGEPTIGGSAADKRWSVPELVPYRWLI